jgi:hypothetical protein
MQCPSTFDFRRLQALQKLEKHASRLLQGFCQYLRLALTAVPAAVTISILPWPTVS